MNTTMDFEFAMRASVSELAVACGIGQATADAEEKAAKLAQNPGFLKGLMVRVQKHFQSAKEGAVRVLSNGGVWMALLSLCIAAISLRFGARSLRHFKMQPMLGKLRVVGVTASFFAFIGAFIGFFKKIAMAWKQETELDVEKRKAAALLASLSEAERVVLMARAREGRDATPAMAALAAALEQNGAVVHVHAAFGDAALKKARKLAAKLCRRGTKFLRRQVRSLVSLAKTETAQRISASLVLASLLLHDKVKRDRAAAEILVGERVREVFESISKSEVSEAVYTEVQKALALLPAA